MPKKKPTRHAKQTPQRPFERRGAVTVELALAVPIFFLFLLASIEFCWLNVVRHTADHAAYEAARHAIVPGATATEATNRANELLQIVQVSGAQVTIDPLVIDENTDEVTVTVDIPMNQNGLLMPQFAANKSILAESTLRTERDD